MTTSFPDILARTKWSISSAVIILGLDSDFVKKYCKSCTTCMCSKPQHYKPYRLLKQLPIPKCPWNSISMDFIETLPTCIGCNSILVIVDQLSKQGIFIPTIIHFTSKDLAILFIMHVFSKHSIPEHVTSDHGLECVSRFSIPSERHLT